MAGFSRHFGASYWDAGHKIYDQKAIGSPFMVRPNTCDLRDETTVGNGGQRGDMKYIPSNIDIDMRKTT